MTTLSTALDTELQKPVITLFCATEVQLPGVTLRLLDGAGVLNFGGHLFAGRDATFGVLGGVSDYTDGVDGEAPTVTLTFLPPTTAAMAAIAASDAQGSPVSFWIGALDKVTGQVIGDPELCFIGETDVPTQGVDTNTRSLDVTVVSIYDRFFDDDEFVRLNGGFQAAIWPGEKGLQFTPLVTQQPYWGSAGPDTSAATALQIGTGLYGRR